MGSRPTLPTGFTQERTTCDPIITVQAPHCAMPHPKRGPFRWSSSANTNSNGVWGSTSTVWLLPFTRRTCFTELRPSSPFSLKQKPQSLGCRLFISQRFDWVGAGGTAGRGPGCDKRGGREGGGNSGEDG